MTGPSWWRGDLTIGWIATLTTTVMVLLLDQLPFRAVAFGIVGFEWAVEGVLTYSAWRSRR